MGPLTKSQGARCAGQELGTRRPEEPGISGFTTKYPTQTSGAGKAVDFVVFGEDVSLVTHGDPGRL